MKTGSAKALLLLGLCLSVASGPPPARGGPGTSLDVMPVPEKVVPGEGLFRIDESLTIGGKAVPGSRAFKAAARFMDRLAGRTGLFFRQDYPASQPAGDAAKISYVCEAGGRLEPFTDESYLLDIRPDRVELAAATDIGIIRGLETLLQLLSSDEAGYYFPGLKIQDKPRFPWRGLLIDSGRHFQPVEVVKRNLDGMAAVKMNVLHWHLTEDQGHRVESRVFPKLQERGSGGMFYSQAQIREVVAYAADRGIRVMPEFDIPGHSTSWFVAYPEYAAARGPYALERKFGVFGPAFNPAEERTYAFFDKFFKEMSSLFSDPYVHIGGDEVNPDQWKSNPAIRAFMKKKGFLDNHALQAYFNGRILKILSRHGKKMVGWDEILQPGLPKDIVIQSWRGQEALVEAARKGYQGLLSNGYYIDLCQPAEFHYLNDPLPTNSLLTEEEKRLVLGGEATMWSELVTPETIDSRIWPRTAAIAERLWSPSSVTNVEDMYRRMFRLSLQLEELGLTHLKNQDMMLRRLAGDEDFGPLKTLAEAVEPLKIYRRHSQGMTYTTLSPLTRFVDACQPESPAAVAFRYQVERFLSTKDPVLAAEIKATLDRWVRNHVRLLEAIIRSPAVREVELLSWNLKMISNLGIQAVDLYLNGNDLLPAWLEEARKTIAEAKRPQAHAELAVVSAVEKLVDTCSAPAR